MNALGRFTALTPDDAAAAIRRDGAAVVEGVWPSGAIDGLRALVLAQHPEFSDPDMLNDYVGSKHERFIAPVVLSTAVWGTGFLERPALGALCAALLGADFVYDAFGITMANPGAERQHTHRDGGSLFPETGIDKILPPSALTISIPLVDVDIDSAPTGVAPGSHRELPHPDEVELIPVELERGDIGVWDFRLVHAGLANRTKHARPALYMTACRPFWVDHKNFGETGRAKLVGDPDVLSELGPEFARAVPA